MTLEHNINLQQSNITTVFRSSQLICLQRTVLHCVVLTVFVVVCHCNFFVLCENKKNMKYHTKISKYTTGILVYPSDSNHSIKTSISLNEMLKESHKHYDFIPTLYNKQLWCIVYKSTYIWLELPNSSLNPASYGLHMNIKSLYHISVLSPNALLQDSFRAVL